MRTLNPMKTVNLISQWSKHTYCFIYCFNVHRQRWMNITHWESKIELNVSSEIEREKQCVKRKMMMQVWRKLEMNRLVHAAILEFQYFMFYINMNDQFRGHNTWKLPFFCDVMPWHWAISSQHSETIKPSGLKLKGHNDQAGFEVSSTN